MATTKLTSGETKRLEYALRSVGEDGQEMALAGVLFVEYPEAEDAEIEGLVAAELSRVRSAGEDRVEIVMHAVAACDDERAAALGAFMELAPFLPGAA